MASAAFIARQQYLHQASQLLISGAASTSAAVGAAFNQTCLLRDKPIAGCYQYENCGCCGNPLIPGRLCRVTLALIDRSSSNLHEILFREHSRLMHGKGKRNKVLVYRCGRCDKETRHPMPKNGEVMPRTFKQAGPTAEHLPPAPLNLTTITKANTTSPELHIMPVPSHIKLAPNAGSKQRAKARKQGGLQAMLAKTRNDLLVANNNEFALMDFMTSG